MKLNDVLGGKAQGYQHDMGTALLEAEPLFDLDSILIDKVLCLSPALRAACEFGDPAAIGICGWVYSQM